MQDLAKIHEIFISVQGEGIFSGKRQLFVRFFGCNLNCAYCDTPQQPNEAVDCTIDDLFLKISQKAAPYDIHSISFTGGEPLMQAEFLKNILPKLKQSDYRIYIDTNGTMPKSLESIIDFVDIVAMDIKLPSSTGMHDFWKEHSEFLKIAMKKIVFVKAVITDKTTYEDFYKAVILVRKADPHIAFILQPVSPQFGVNAVDSEVLNKFKNIASEYIHKVKIIPQMHKVFGIK